MIHPQWQRLQALPVIPRAHCDPIRVPSQGRVIANRSNSGLDDLCVRFIINLPHEELESVERICFQVEEAQWFYEDFIRPLDPDLPSLNLKNFCLRIFQHCPLLSEFSSYHHSTAFSEFLAYKTRVPVRGAIMLNQDMDQVVLVKGWKKSANWSFPRGKINKDEPDLDCAVREVYEETGFHLKDAGLVGNDEDMKYIEITMREQHMRLYVFRGVPLDAHFEPRTRKEISKVMWYKLSELPTLKKQKQQQEGRKEDLAVNANKFYMVAPFMVPLKKWIAQRRNIEKHTSQSLSSTTPMKMNGKMAVPEKSTSPGNSFNSLPTPNDLDGLMAKLHQSNQAKIASDPSEASRPSVSAQDASAHLKSLLHASPNIVENNKLSTPTVSETLNPGTLLALLQPAGPTQHDVPSQVPLEKLSGEHMSPPILNNRYNNLESRSKHSPAVQPIPSQESQSMSHSSFPSTISSKNQPIQTFATYQTPKPFRLSQPSVHRDTFQTRFGSQMPPPYLRTGDPDFAQNSQIPGIHTLSVPPANKLPRPNLTTHSSALLNLFKSAQPLEVRAADSFPVTGSSIGAMQLNEVIRASEVVPEGKTSQGPLEDETFPLPLPPTPLQESARTSKPESILPRTTSSRSTQQHPSEVSMRGNRSPADRTTVERVDARFETKPSTQTPGSNIPAKRRSGHQDTLLDLFQKTEVAERVNPPTHSPTGLSMQTLEPPPTLVELSAMPSPAHSREPSHVKTRTSTPGSGTTAKRPSTVAAKPATLRPRKPPVSATVNGPLDVPQFDVLANSSKAGKGFPPNHHPIPQRRSPVTIPRPVSARDPESLFKQRGPMTSEKPPEKPSLTTKDLGSQNSNSDMTDAHLQLDQSQILHQPGPVLRASQDLAVPSPIQPLPSPTLNPRFINGKSKPKDQKNLLLSLFTKPSPLTNPVTSNPADVISPISEMPTLQRPQSPAVPTAATRSRMGSLTSATGERSTRIGSVVQTPRTAPGNKTILLGYLEEVAKGKRR